jgi:hypothetical protein
MTLEKLALKLGGLLPGGRLGLSYGLFAQLFPPGEQDVAAGEACFNFAREHGCRIDWPEGQLWFCERPRSSGAFSSLLSAAERLRALQATKRPNPWDYRPRGK